MEDLFKYGFAAILGSIISPLWMKYLARTKNKLEEEKLKNEVSKSKVEEDKLRNDECIQTLNIFKDSINELKRQVEDLKSKERDAQLKIQELQEYNERQDKYYNLKILELKDLNISQGKKIIELENQIKILNAEKKETKRSSAKKTKSLAA